MARTAGAAGMLDIRSAAIFEDFVYASNTCLPGATEAKSRRYYGSALFQDLPLDADQRNPKNYDRVKDWIAAFCSFTICLTIFGLIHSGTLSHPRAVMVYGFGFVEISLIASFSYAIVMIFGPLAACIVRRIGHRLTCIFGMLLFFIGLVLDALDIHQALYLIGHILLMGFGACLAITAATSAVVDHFRHHLPYALTFLSCASPIGTMFFFVFTYFLTVYEPIDYRWKVITFAVIVLILIAATHSLPTSIRIVKHPNPFYKKETKGRGVQECIDEAALAEEEARRCDPEYQPGPQDQKPCLCVCVCDISILTDLSFLLWAGISSCAMLTVFVPYLLVVAYAAEDRGIDYYDAIWLIIWYCVGSILTRLTIMLGKDHTLVYNRSAFQVAIIGSGILYYFLTLASTYGWLLCWCLIMGAIEGVLMTSIPRVTMQTIPRKHMICSWSYIVVFHGIAILLGPYLFTSARASDGNLYIACLAVGLAQILAGFLAFLLPDEQQGDPEEEADLEDSEDTGSQFGIAGAVGSGGYSGFNGGSNMYGAPVAVVKSSSFVAAFKARNMKGGLGKHRGKDCCTHGNYDYINKCPICSEIGCVPGCSDCIPGGLADGSVRPMFDSTQPSIPILGPSRTPTSSFPTTSSATRGNVKITEFEVRLTKEQTGNSSDGKP